MRKYFLEMSSRHVNSDNLRENSKRSSRCKVKSYQSPPALTFCAGLDF